MSEHLSVHVPVRLTASVKARGEHLAREDGMTVSAWVRRLVQRELIRREGECPTCGQRQVDE